MNRFHFVVYCLTLVAASLIRAEEPMFAGIPWLTQAEEVKKLMANKGYVCLGTTKETADEFTRNSPLGKTLISDLDLVFIGEMLQTKCRIKIVFNGSNQMVGVDLSFKDEYHHHREPVSTLGDGLGVQIYSQLEAKYGKPEPELVTEEKDRLGTISKRYGWGKPRTNAVVIRLYTDTQTKIFYEDRVADGNKLTSVSVTYTHPLLSAEYRRRKAEREKNSKKDDL